MTRALRLDDFAPMAPPWGAPLQAASFDDSGRWLSFLQPRAGTDLLDLAVFDLENASSRVVLAGEPPTAPRGLAWQLARERARMRYDGVTHACWLPGKAVLYSVQGDCIFFVDVPSGAVRQYRHPAHIDSANAAADAQQIAFASAQQLWCLPLADGVATGPARPITADGSPELLHGVPDPVTAEELFNGGAYLWSPDSRQLLVASFDVAAVDALPVPAAPQASAETTRYGRPGRPVATFALSLVAAAGGERRPVLAADADWPYFLDLVRRDAEHALLMRMSRDQTRVQWRTIRWADGHQALLLERTQQPWINAPGKPLFRSVDGSFLIVHEAAGSGRIGLFDRQGGWQLDFGAEAGHVESLLALDASQQGVYFIGTGGDARERHLFHALAADGWQSRRLTAACGVHAATPSRDGRLLVTCDRPESGAEVSIQERDGRVAHRFAAPALPYEQSLVQPRFVDVLAADGTTPLHAAVYEPPQAAAGPRAVVLLVYGGPHGQAVRRSRALTLDLRAQWLAACGYVVVKVDNRGTNGRGFDFERAIHGRLGHVEVDDQCSALEQILATHPRADRRRVGVVGWSYGGYMALRCLQRRPDVFACAVAGAPVVDWMDYDAPYTERYMGSPGSNADGYPAARADPFALGTLRPLLLVHGLNDENVLFRHSAALIESLARSRIAYELLLMPDERHSIRQPHQRAYLEWRIQKFFDQHLGAGAP